METEELNCLVAKASNESLNFPAMAPTPSIACSFAASQAIYILGEAPTPSMNNTFRCIASLPFSRGSDGPVSDNSRVRVSLHLLMR